MSIVVQTHRKPTKMNGKSAAKIALALALSAAATTGSAIDLGGALGAGSKLAKGATLSEQEVRENAAQACAYMDQNNKVAPAGNPYAKRLAAITKGLNNEDGLQLDFKAYLVQDVNAFAMANGCVRVFAGLMDQFSDDEVRGVIGHEIGHVKLGHSLSKMRTALLTAGAREGVAASGKGRASEIAASQIGGLAESVVNSQFSQKEELAADEYGYHFMVRHSYDPNAMVSMFKKLGGSGGLVSSHPASPKRAKNIESLIAKGAKKK